MTVVLQGTANFPGITQVLKARYTMSHGISPGVCVIECVPQIGLTLRDGALVYAPKAGVFFGLQMSTGKVLAPRLGVTDTSCSDCSHTRGRRSGRSSSCCCRCCC